MDAESILYDELERMGTGGEIKEPEAIYDLLKLFYELSSDYQLILLEQLEKIARSLLHNPNLMVTNNRRKEEVLNILITLALNNNEYIKTKILSFIELLVSSVGAKKSNTQHMFQLLARQKTDEDQLKTSIQILQILISPYKPLAPYSYFYFSGQGSGLSINFEKFPSFSFSKGLSACFWLRVEDVNNNKPSRLMLFHSKGNGGIEAYFVNHSLYYRILGPEYTLPEPGSNGILLHKFQPET